MSTTQIRGTTQIMPGSITTTQIAAAAGITDAQLANGANYLKKDGSVAMTASLDMGSHTIINVSNPVNPTDAANKSYVDTLVQGLTQKPTARVATAAALASYAYSNGASGVGATLTGSVNNTQLTVDGVTLAVGDLVLVKNEVGAGAPYNGLYVVTQKADASHPYIFTRHIDMDSSNEFDGAFIPVDNEGTANPNTLWLVNNLGAVTVGTTAVTFTQLASATSYTPGNGITISGTVISADIGNGLTFSGTHTVVSPDATGGANLSRSINVSANGVAVKVDNTTITEGTSGQLKVKDGGIGPTQMAAQAAGTGLTGGAGTNLSVQVSVRETPTGVVNGSNTSYTLAHTPMAGTEQVYLNGLLQEAGAGNDYTISSNTITYLAAPLSGDRVRVTYYF